MPSVSTQSKVRSASACAAASPFAADRACAPSRSSRVPSGNRDQSVPGSHRAFPSASGRHVQRESSSTDATSGQPSPNRLEPLLRVRSPPHRPFAASRSFATRSARSRRPGGPNAQAVPSDRHCVFAPEALPHVTFSWRVGVTTWAFPHCPQEKSLLRDTPCHAF